MPNARATHLTRRGVLAAGGALGLGAVLAACGDDDAKSEGSGEATTAAKSGPWTFKDDRGTTVKLDKVPTKIVAFVGVAAALYDYGIEINGVFGPTTTKDGKADVQAGDMDVSKLTVFGNVWDQFNVEKYAAFAPEVLLTTIFDSAGTLWYVPQASRTRSLKLAPSAGISVYDRQLTQPLERMWELAESLGADLKADKVVQAKKDFEAAAERLRKAANRARDQGHGRFRQPGHLLRLRHELLHRPGVLQGPRRELRRAAGERQEGEWRLVREPQLGERRQVPGRHHLDGRPLLDDPAGRHHRGRPGRSCPPSRPARSSPAPPSRSLSYDKCTPLLESLAKAIEKAKKVA